MLSGACAFVRVCVFLPAVLRFLNMFKNLLVGLFPSNSALTGLKAKKAIDQFCLADVSVLCFFPQ